MLIHINLYLFFYPTMSKSNLIINMRFKNLWS
jgi:hypothetical protein